MEDDLTFDQIVGLKTLPVIVVDEYGMIQRINSAFTRAYGWARSDLVGTPLESVIPAMLRFGHDVAIKRFYEDHGGDNALALKHHEELMLLKDGTEAVVDHYICGEKRDGHWLFASVTTLL